MMVGGLNVADDGPTVVVDEASDLARIEAAVDLATVTD